MDPTCFRNHSVDLEWRSFKHRTYPAMINLLIFHHCWWAEDGSNTLTAPSPGDWGNGRGGFDKSQLCGLHPKGIALWCIFTCLNPALGFLMLQKPASWPCKSSMVFLLAMYTSDQHPNRTHTCTTCSLAKLSPAGSPTCIAVNGEGTQVTGRAEGKPRRPWLRQSWSIPLVSQSKNLEDVTWRRTWTLLFSRPGKPQPCTSQTFSSSRLSGVFTLYIKRVVVALECPSQFLSLC